MSEDKATEPVEAKLAEWRDAAEQDYENAKANGLPAMEAVCKGEMVAYARALNLVRRTRPAPSSLEAGAYAGDLLALDEFLATKHATPLERQAWARVRALVVMRQAAAPTAGAPTQAAEVRAADKLKDAACGILWDMVSNLSHAEGGDEETADAIVTSAAAKILGLAGGAGSQAPGARPAGGEG